MKNIKKIDSYVFDERFYQSINEEGERIYQPSVTHILSLYPKFGLSEWRGDVGNKRADEILDETSTLGSYVHESIEHILKGEKIAQNDIQLKFKPKPALKVYRCLAAFLEWFEEYKPEVLSTEYIVWGDGYAGTIDLKCIINDEIYIVDFKTSKALYEAHKVQICAYGLVGKVDKVALLHLGNTTKKKWSFNVLKDDDREKFTNQFHSVHNLFKTLKPDAKPSEEVFPEYFTLDKKEER